MSLGREIPQWCDDVVSKSQAQIFLLNKNTSTSKAINTILQELLPLLFEHICALPEHDELPFTQHQKKVIQNAIAFYLQNH